MLNSSLTDDQRTLLDAVHRYDACCLRVLDLGLDLSSIDDLDVTAVGGLGALGGALPVDLFRSRYVGFPGSI